MKKTILVLAVAFSGLAVNAQTTEWNADPSHSRVRFTVEHLLISEVEGRFDKYEGSVLSDKSDFSDAKVEFTITTSSVNTGDEKRDAHLKGSDFFDSEKYPTITFKSKTMKKVGENKYKVTGDYTMHGVTKELIFDVKYGGTVKDPWGNTKAGFKVTGTIDRTEFGLKYNSTLDTGGLMIGEEIEITCNLEMIKKVN